MSLSYASDAGRGKKLVITAFVILLTLGLAVAAFAPGEGTASSHREAPLVSADPQIDGTDFYMYVSPDDPTKVTFVSSWLPFEEPAGGPNFYSFAEKARYNVYVSNDGDAKPEITYRWTFKDHYRNPDVFLYTTGPVTSLDDNELNFYQTYDLSIVKGGNTTKVINDEVVVPNNVGEASMPAFESLFEEGTTTFGGDSRSWAGQSDDPFFLDLRIFDLLYGADFSEAGDDTLAGFNVQTMVLEVPIADIAKGGNATENPIIGAWTTADRKSTRVQKADGTQKYSDEWVQVSRLGMPLVNEAVIANIDDRNRFNSSKPKNDGQFLDYVTEPLVPVLVEAIYGIPAPATPRDDLVAVFLTGVDGLNQPPNVQPSEMLRLNTSIPPCESPGCTEYSSLGVIGGDTAGYPNGRRLADDVIDITLQVAEGELAGSPNDLADGVNVNDLLFRDEFPWVGLPHSGSDAAPHQ